MDNKEFDFIDKLAKEALEKFEVDLDTNAWGEFESMLEEEERKPKFWLFKGLEIGLMALLTLGLYSIIPLGSVEETKLAQTNLTVESTAMESKGFNYKQKSAAQEKNKQATREFEDKHYIEEGHSTMLTDHTHSRQTNATGPQETRVIPLYKEGANKSSNKAQEEKAFSSKATKEKQENNILEGGMNFVEENLSNVGVNKTGSASNQGFAMGGSNQNTTVNTFNQNTAVVMTNEKTVIDPLSINPLKVDLLAVNENQHIVEPIAQLENEERIKETYRKRLFLGGSIGVDANLKNSQGNTGLGYSARFFMDYTLTKKFFLRSGLELSHKLYRSEDQSLLPSTVQLVDKDVNNITVSSFEHKSNLITFSIPVSMQYMVIDNDKWKIYPGLGFAATAVLSRINSSDITAYNAVDDEIDRTFIDDNYYGSDRKGLLQGNSRQNFYLSSIISVGVERKVNKNLYLFGRPEFRYALLKNGINGDKNNSFSFVVGLRKEL